MQKNRLINHSLGQSGMSMFIYNIALELKNRKLYRFIDKYYIYDLLKLVFLGKYVSEVSLIKQSLLGNLKLK